MIYILVGLACVLIFGVLSWVFIPYWKEEEGWYDIPVQDPIGLDDATQAITEAMSKDKTGEQHILTLTSLMAYLKGRNNITDPDWIASIHWALEENDKLRNELLDVSGLRDKIDEEKLTKLKELLKV